MVKVLTPEEMVSGYTGIVGASLNSGSMQALPMTEEEKQAAAEKPRPPFGFVKP